MNSLVIHFDGGCRPTNPGNKYGSFEVQLNGKCIHKEHYRELGLGTNNEAEFDILIVALDWTIKALENFGNDPSKFTLDIYSDSTIVVNRLLGRYRKKNSEPAMRMYALNAQCLSRTARFKSFTPHWNVRDNNVSRFGH